MSAPVDVLAVMDREIACEHVPGFVADQLAEARAAVAELMEAAHHAEQWITEVRDRKGLPTAITLPKLRAALARCGGAK